MSRTRKTRPLSVRIADKEDKKVGHVEVHNHINHDCDLPASLAEAVKTDAWLEARKTGRVPCHYSFTYTGHGVCGCKMCTNQLERKTENRRVRHESKTSFKKLTEEFN